MNEMETYIKSFLNFGYSIDYENKIKFDYDKIKPIQEPSLTEAKDLFLSALHKSTSHFNGKIIVPLSGGLDSRFILSGLSELYSNDRLETYTFGTKGTYDFDLGVATSKKLFIKNKSYEIKNNEYTEKMLLDTSKLFDANTLLFYHPPYEEILDNHSGGLFVSGFMGDPIAGSHYLDDCNLTDREVANEFIKRNKFVSSVKLKEIGHEDVLGNIKLQDCDCYNITRTEYVDFELRQLKYIAPHVVPSGIDIVTPFTDIDFFSYMMGLNKSCRREQGFYHQLMLSSYPREFSLPCKNKLGLKLSTNDCVYNIWRACHRLNFLNKKKLNYQDFNMRIVHDEKFKRLLFDLINQLEERNISMNVSPSELLSKHLDHTPIYADAILTMASLEVNLRD